MQVMQSHKKLLEIKEYEEFPRDVIEKDKIVIKFECKGLADA